MPRTRPKTSRKSPRGSFAGATPGDSTATPAARGADPDPQRMLDLLLSPELLDSRDKRGRTPLFRAIEKGQVELVRFLATRCDLLAPNDADETALAFAASQGEPGCVQALLDIAPDPFALARFHNSKGAWPAIFHAAQSNAECVRALLPFAAPENGFGVENPADFDHTTPVMLAAGSADWETLELFLPFCDPNAVNRHGATALTAAVRRNASPQKSEILRRFFALSGFDPNANAGLKHLPNFHELIPLGLALRLRDMESLRLLLPACDPDALTNKEGKTLLMLSLAVGDFECFEALLPFCGDSLSARQLGAQQATAFAQALAHAVRRGDARFADALGARLLETRRFGEEELAGLRLFRDHPTQGGAGRLSAEEFRSSFPRLHAAREAISLRACLDAGGAPAGSAGLDSPGAPSRATLRL